GPPFVGQTQQVLGGIHDLRGNPEQAAVHVRGAAGEAAQRGGGDGEAVGGFVDRAVAAEGHDHVEALVRGLARQRSGVPTVLRVHRLHLVAPAQGVYDEVLEPVGDRRRV